MEGKKQIRNALVSVFNKEGLDVIAKELNRQGVRFFSTGGTRTFLESLGIEVTAVEDVTKYPEILGGRVKTLHPKIFGGILGRRHEEQDLAQLESFDIPEIDLVIVDLYPFEETLKSGAPEADIIEKIDIGGISLIRAAAKNFNDVLVVPSLHDYPELLRIVTQQRGFSTISDRKELAGRAFNVSASYDRMIASWFGYPPEKKLRYGENPHQSGEYIGDLSKVIEQLHGKELSYNNLLDIDAALRLIQDFPGPGCAVIKHNNACGAALDSDQLKAWEKALAGDPLSAFGGIIVLNSPLTQTTAEAIDSLFFEVILAPAYEHAALEILQKKKNRIILVMKPFEWPELQYRSVLNGMLQQGADLKTETPESFETVTQVKPTQKQLDDLSFALVLVKHTKSNAIVLVKDRQMIASGTGQTSRVDALKQAIDKAVRMGFSLAESVMASDAFFPFPDCVEIAGDEKIAAIAQPGGSVRDQDSIDAANRLNISMVSTGIRHFKH